MKKTLIIALLALVAMAGQAKEEKEVVWDEIAWGMTNFNEHVKVQKVALFPDRSEVTLSLNFPKEAVGHSFPLASKTVINADGKDYAIKGASGIPLGEDFSIQKEGDTIFTLIFEPLPLDAKVLYIIEPETWYILGIRNPNLQPKDIVNTYWRNTQTGDWLIGFTEKYAIYDCKVVGIADKKEKGGTYMLTLEDGTTVKVGKMKKDVRHITIGNRKPVVCNAIMTTALPDYPTKDTRTGFYDTGFQVDTVTIVGWLKDMPKSEWDKGREIGFTYKNALNNKYENIFAKMDSLGRFTLKFPLLNTTEIYFDWNRTRINTMVEPGQTYFLLSDYVTGQKLFMGENVRLQNELIAHPESTGGDYLSRDESGKVDDMEFKARTDKTLARRMNELQENIAKYPNLSQRYIDYLTGYYRAAQGEDMIQARYAMPNWELKQEYMDYLGKEIWQKAPKPFTLYRDFVLFRRSYIDHLIRERDVLHGRSFAFSIITENDTLIVGDRKTLNMRRLKEMGKLAITDEELATIDHIVKLESSIFDNVGDTTYVLTKEEQEKMEEYKQKCLEIFGREDIKKVLAVEEPLVDVYQMLDILDSVGCDQNMRDIILANHFYESINRETMPFNESTMQYIDSNIKMPAAKALLHAEQEKFLALQRNDFSNAASLKSAENVAEMSDGEQILRKLMEPYKGKAIFLDVWGKWCGPCRAALAKSQEEYERLKDYDVVFLYLANNSPDEEWKNVIKMNNVTGENVVHYNLPREQQSAIEHFLNVSGFPTFKLIAPDGSILDVDVSPYELESVAKLLDKMNVRKD